MLGSGAQLFARYAYPPNELGYCGPADASVLLRRDAGADLDIARHARQFEGAWAYLELIAQHAAIGDPLDERVVEAYWVGNDLLDLLPPDDVARELQQRLPPQPGAAFFAGHAHHGYQVFAVYPWVGLLARSRASGAVAQAVRILDQCRIRWGEVRGIDGEHAVVACRPLRYGDGELELGGPIEQRVAISSGGRSLLPAAELAAGAQIAMHWDWACDVLDDAQVARLARHTADQLACANEVLAARG